MEPSHPSVPEPFPREPIPPEIVEWARQTFDEEEFLAQLHADPDVTGYSLFSPLDDTFLYPFGCEVATNA